MLSGIWDSLSNNVINTVTFGVHAIQCGAINAYNPVTCPDFDHNVRMLTDERYRLETRQAEILALAEAFGDASDNLTSDDPYVSARAYTDVLTFAAFLAKGIAGARTGAARGAVVVRTPTVSDLAGDVANATGGSLRQLKGGFSVAVPYGKRGIVIRVMAEGGKRTNYYRVSIPGLKSFAVDGTVSTDKALTHIPIGETSLDDIIRLVNLIKGSE